MKKIIAIALTILALASSSFAQTTLVERVDSRKNAVPFVVSGIITPRIEIWGFGIGQPNPTVEIGRLVLVHSSKNSLVLAGGYASRWGNGKMFIEPFVVAKKDFGDLRIKASLFAYLPLNGGPTVLGSSDINLTGKVTPNLRLGFGTSFWKEPGIPCPMNWGPYAEITKGKTDIIVRYTPFGNGEPSFRFQICQTL